MIWGLTKGLDQLLLCLVIKKANAKLKMNANQNYRTKFFINVLIELTVRSITRDAQY